jgi:predicted DNA-binding transcriptional regulator YafY
MNRLDRLHAIILRLQASRVTTAAQLADHFEIAVRTIYRDLASLAEAGVPLAAEPGAGYRLLPGYHLPPVRLDEEEAFALSTAGLLAEAPAEPRWRGKLRSALAKVRATLPPEFIRRLEHLDSVTLVSPPQADTGPRAEAARAVPLARLQALLAERRVVLLGYKKPADHAPGPRLVEPAGLVFHAGRWHLFAWCRLRNEWRDFRTDRILSAEALPERCARRADGDVKSLLARFAHPPEGIRVKVRFTADIVEAPLRHWGPSVLKPPETLPGGDVRLEFRCADLDYAARWLLGLGQEMVVESPARLRAAVLATARAVARSHGDTAPARQAQRAATRPRL